MSEYNQTEEKIVEAALYVILAHGIKKTTIEDVAARCGLTRATVYRYFKDKRRLIRASILHMVSVLNEALASMDKHRYYDTEKSATLIKEAVSSMPKGDISARIMELKQLYPDIFAEYQLARLASIRGIYRRVFNAAKRDGLITPSETDWNLVQTILSEATLYVAESPLVLSHGKSVGHIYSAVLDIMLYGIMGRRKK
jgi:AcrR family transcriptional regulator